jgi:hypothetical protein
VTKLPDGKLASLIQEVLNETEQPVVLFTEDGELKIGVLEQMPEEPDWYFAPVAAADAEEKLGADEISRM